MSDVPPTYEELLQSLEQLEQRFKALEKAHDDLLMDLQARVAKIQASIDAGLHSPSSKP